MIGSIHIQVIRTAQFFRLSLQQSWTYYLKYKKTNVSKLNWNYFCKIIVHKKQTHIHPYSHIHTHLPNSIPISSLYILSSWMMLSNSFLLVANSLMPSMYIRWLDCSYVFTSLFLTVHFLIMWLSRIFAITNSKCDSASPWRIPLWIFTSSMLSPPAVSSTYQFYVVFSIKFMTFSDILCILRQYFDEEIWHPHTFAGLWEKELWLCGNILHTFL